MKTQLLDDGTLLITDDEARLMIHVSVTEENVIDPRYAVIVKAAQIGDTLHANFGHEGTHFSRMIYGSVAPDERIRKDD